MYVKVQKPSSFHLFIDAPCVLVTQLDERQKFAEAAEQVPDGGHDAFPEFASSGSPWHREGAIGIDRLRSVFLPYLAFGSVVQPEAVRPPYRQKGGPSEGP